MRQRLAVVVVVVVALVTLGAQQGRGVAAGVPLTPRALAPVDLTGYWVAVITEDWRWRMQTPPRGDYASLPLNDEGRRVADAWDPARDEATGNACKPFGVGHIMRMPGRLRISWQDDRTFKLEFDAGTQTRLLYFGDRRPQSGRDRTWQGDSLAEWVPFGQHVSTDRNAIPQPGRGGAAVDGLATGGSLKVVTTNMRAGYLRKNGVPYSGNAVVTEHFDRVQPEPDGEVFLIVRSVVEDPTYLQMPFITSTNFKQERDGARWRPTPCTIGPPVEFARLP